MAARGKELRALITLAGKLDPSLSSALAKAAEQSAKSSQKIGKDWKSLGKGIKTGAIGLAKGIGVGIMAVAAAATVAFGAMGASGLQYASDLQEVQNVVDVTFEKNAAVLDVFASKSLETYGLTTLEAKKYNSVLGAMLKSMQVSEEETLIMSQNMAALAGDMASFYNLSGDEAFEKIRSGISGETEPLKQLGINMSVANMEAYALSQGITTAYQKMSQADQAILRYNYLMSVTADAQGDFARTSDSFANQQKLLKANLQQTSGEIMQNMMPALAAAMKEANQFIRGLDTQAVGQFAGEIAGMAAQFLPLVMELMPTFGQLLMMLLPPLLQLGQMVIPVLVSVAGSLMEAIQPVLPVIMQFAQDLLPPIMQFLQAMGPLIAAIGKLCSTILAPVLQTIAQLLTPILDVLTFIMNVAGKIVNFIAEISGSKLGQGVMKFGLSNPIISGTVNAMQGYANGGLTDKPAIFGEAGMEMAIPIRPGNPRSLNLLKRTADLLGVPIGGDQKQMQFQFAPVIHMDGGSDVDGKIDRALQRGYEQFCRWAKEFFAGQGRLAWE